MLPLMLIEMGGGGGNNLSLNTPGQSALDSSSNALSSSLRDLRQQVVAIHKSTQVDSSNDYSASAESMDCHAVVTAPARNDSINAFSPSLRSPLGLKQSTQANAPSKSTRLSLSLACFFALSGIAAAATPTIPENDPNNLLSQLENKTCRGYVDGRHHNNCYNIMWQTTNKQGATNSSMSGNWNFGDRGSYGDVSHYTYASVAVAYRPGGFSGKRFWFANDTRVDHLAFNLKKVGEGDSPWLNLVNSNNLNVTTLDVIGDVMFEVKLGGNSEITTINNAADRLSLTANGNSSLTIQTLNQNRADSELVIQNASGSVTIDTLNQGGGSVYQRSEEVTTANITGGHYYQGYGPSGSGYAPVGDGGRIGTLNLQGGDFTQYAGQITTANLSGGVFTHKGGTLSSVVLKAGGSGSTFVNGTDSAFANITQEGGNHTIIGKVTKFTLASGSFTNNGSIETLTTNTTTTAQSRSAFRNAPDTRAATNHITNNGTIDKLELTKDADSVTNNAVYNTGGGLASGIIKELSVTKGNATINTLNGVGQGTAGNVEPHTLSNINITKDAKLTVDTLSVGLKGNQAIERVTINNNTGGQGGNTEFAVNKIQVTYIDGTFDPAKSISKNLKDYVTSGTSQSYVDGASKPTFESSPELQGIGVKFNPDGTPIFEVEASLAASMTSVVVRQSMRRKMLIDTYLAEQNRRSLKNKERRTKQRIEAATLAECKSPVSKRFSQIQARLSQMGQTC